MIAIVLVENNSLHSWLKSEHGLSLYIESNGIKLLFDTGASDTFSVNANTLHIDLSQVEHAIISHSHYDHSGGLDTFSTLNNKAKIYIHQQAFHDYYSLRSDGLHKIGIHKKWQNNTNVVLTKNTTYINEQMYLFSNIDIQVEIPSANKTLYQEKEGEIILDDFTHEQYLVIKEKNIVTLFTGCSHNGIQNILQAFYQIEGRYPDVVIGGFHLTSKANGDESDSVIDKLGKYLLSTHCMFYTCHCTGEKPYQRLKKILKDNIQHIVVGSIIEKTI